MSKNWYLFRFYLVGFWCVWVRVLGWSKSLAVCRGNEHFVEHSLFVLEIFINNNNSVIFAFYISICVAEKLIQSPTLQYPPIKMPPENAKYENYTDVWIAVKTIEGERKKISNKIIRKIQQKSSYILWADNKWKWL